MPSERAALFDMDRTLVSEHTSRLFTHYRRQLGEQGRLDSLRVGYWLMLYTLGFVNAPRVARAALAEYRGTLEQDMALRCREWFPTWVRPHISEAARATVERHRQAGDTLAIVTGSTRYSASLLAEELGIESVICSSVEIDGEGRFTGEVIEPLCLGVGKVTLTREFLEARGLSLKKSTFYSDSMTDEPLLSLVDQPIVVNPDFRLRRVARRRGWPILAW